MMSLKQAAPGWCFVRDDVTTEVFLKGLVELSIPGVEMIDPQYWSMANDLGLTIATHGGHATLTDGLNKPENHERIEEELLKNLELAQEYNIVNLICFSGDRYEGITDEEGLDITARGLERVAKAAEAAGITLVLELLNSKVNHPNYQCDKTPWGVEVCQRVDSPRVKLLYDIYHMQIMEGDIIRTIQESHRYIGHYHTAGNPGRNDLDDQQEIYYPPIFKAIADTGYEGFIGHEFIPKGDWKESLRQADALCQVG
jgi:hydroxypyruvate isomerase